MFATTLALVFAMSTQRAAGLPSDSTELEPAGSYPFRSGSTVALDTARSLAFVGAGSGVFVVDVANPSEPRILSDRIRCGTLVKDMLLAGTRLYVALLSFAARPDLPRDVEVWDVSVATQPLRLGGIDLSFGAQCVHAIGDTLLVGSLRSLFTYDVSDPGNPVRLDSVPHWSMADEICVRDTLAYVSSSAAGVQVYNLRSPAHPSFIAEWGASCSYPGLDVVGDRLYLVGAAGEFGSESGLRIYDVADPRQGQLLGVFDTAMTSAYRVAVFDTIAAVCYRSSEGVKLVSVADPSAPAQLSARGNDCMGVAVHGSVAYLAFRDRFEVLGVADPSHPVTLGSVPLGLAGSQLVVDRGMVYSIGGSFAVLDAHSSLDVELAGALDLGAHSWALPKATRWRWSRCSTIPAGAEWTS